MDTGRTVVSIGGRAWDRGPAPAGYARIGVRTPPPRCDLGPRLCCDGTARRGGTRYPLYSFQAKYPVNVPVVAPLALAFANVNPRPDVALTTIGLS